VPAVEGFPVHDALSKVSPDNPVLLTHASGHATFANARAMALAGVTRRTANPAGGEILKDARGNPIGVFRERASGLVRSALAAARARRTPDQIAADARREIDLAVEDCLSKGLTTVNDLGVPFETIDLYKQAVAEGRLRLRLYVMVRDDNARMAANLARYRVVNMGEKRLTVRTIKKSIDGALGPRGAWLLEPYADMRSSTGLNTASIEEVTEAARLAIAHDYQLAVHAIGDRANRETLNIFEAAFKANPDRKDLRWRVEHAQHLNAAEIPRFAALGVIPSMQGIHCSSDAPYVLARLGPARAEEGAYVWRSLMKTGAIIANGTDAPVEDVDPVASFHASVTRRMKSGEVFYGGQKMTREEALRSYTLNGAYAAFEEGIKGSLAPGKLADITVFSKNLLTAPDDELARAEVVCTIVGGKVMYQK
jgi:predicted amidohydrolase YtcJ